MNNNEVSTNYEDVILTYVYSPTKKETLECIINSTTGKVKVGIDVWREMDLHDTPSYQVREYDSVERMNMFYEVLKDKRYEACKKIVKGTTEKGVKKTYGLH